MTHGSTTAENRRADLVPSSALPLAYFALAHLAFASALLVLILRPGVPGAFFYHPKMVALVHLLTVGWISGSILGAFHIVAPLALRMPMPVGSVDWIAFAAFAIGAAGMIVHVWIGEYNGMAWSAGLVTATLSWVAIRAWRGLPRAVVPWGVKLHVALAFANILSAAAFGIVLGIDRANGFLGLSPIAATFAHAHLAAVGWAMMMVIGLAYRLIPMMLPAAMPTGASIALSAVLIETGLAVVVVALLRGLPWLAVGGLLIAAGFASFVVHIRRAVERRMPRPPALPRRDWSTWQTHAAMLWVLIAVASGLAAAVGVPARWTPAVTWTYGVAGLTGFLAQIVVGIQGRLMPMYAWYRAFAAGGNVPPHQGANDLPSATFARLLFLLWTAAVPLLTCGLVMEIRPLISASAALLLSAVLTGALYVASMMEKARTPSSRA